MNAREVSNQPPTHVHVKYSLASFPGAYGLGSGMRLDAALHMHIATMYHDLVREHSRHVPPIRYYARYKFKFHCDNTAWEYWGGSVI